jgi:hypothetical protein
MVKKWIQKAIKKPGALTKTAKAHGMTVAEFIAHPPKGISTKTKRRIALAKTLRKFSKNRKKKK